MLFYWLLTTGYCLLQSCPVRHVFGEGGEDGAALFAEGGREHHALRLEAAELARLQIRDDDHLAPDEFLRLVVFGYPGENLARLRLAEGFGEAQKPVGTRHAPRRHHP